MSMHFQTDRDENKEIHQLGNVRQIPRNNIKLKELYENWLKKESALGLTCNA